MLVGINGEEKSLGPKNQEGGRVKKKLLGRKILSVIRVHKYPPPRSNSNRWTVDSGQ